MALSLGLLLPLAPSWTRIANAAEWKLVDKQDKSYFVPLDQIQKLSNSKRTRSELASKSKVKRNETAKNSRELGTPKSALSKEEAPGSKSFENKVEGRYQNTYETWPVVTYKVTTTTTPYVDYEIRAWQEATKDAYRNTYEVTEEVSWVEPVTGNPKSFTRKYTEGPVEEAVQGPWTDQTSKREIGRANDVQVAKEAIANRKESKRIRTALAAADAAAIDSSVGKSPGGVGFSAEGGKGAATARFSTYQKGLGLSGSGHARSRGGGKNSFDFDALLDLAGAQPNLYDDGAKPAWKLTADGKNLVFTPYDAAGQLDNDSRVVLAKGARVGSGGHGAHVSVEAYSASPAALLGSFRTPKGKQSSRLSVR